MEHENFPVAGFEFMNEPATDAQKDLIAELAAKAGEPIDKNGKWPSPFTRWDAKNMIEALTAQLPVTPTCNQDEQEQLAKSKLELAELLRDQIKDPVKP